MLERILSRGYITTRVLLPSQDLSSGILHFELVPGTVSAVRFADPASRGTLRTAFPGRPGDVLNLRDLEQGLEQLRRVSNQNADMQFGNHDLGSHVFRVLRRAHTV